MKDFVIYSVMVGGYEEILQPTIVDDRFDYVLFSNDFTQTKIGVWQVRPIPHYVCDEEDKKRFSRYPKTHPETMLSEYRASLYIDANLQIIDKWIYDRYAELVNKNVEFAGVKLVLTGRDCIYEHAYDMSNVCVVHDFDALQQLHALYQLGFPRHFGLNENNLIFRMHTERMKKVDDEWWDWIITHSFRDQLSYMYCLWKYNVPIEYFLPEGMDTGNGNYIKRIEHNYSEIVAQTKFLHLGFFERCRRKCRISNRYNCNKYLIDWHKIYQSQHPVMVNVLWGIYATILTAPLVLCHKIRSILSQ